MSNTPLTHDLGTSPTGILTATYYEDRAKVVFRSPTAKLWKFTVDAEHGNCLTCFSELAEAVQKDGTVSDLIWASAIIRNIPTWEDVGFSGV